ncbi:MAG TPA: type III secretion system stator protein SctL [Terriglobales bacterium]|nr:type III secretion system stator protein SctL [Terriglobales bacterium]
MSDKILKPELFSEKLPISSAKVLKREVYEASRDARDVVTQAQERARQIIAQAEDQCEAIRAQAREEGYASGLAEWNQILGETRQRADELARTWEETMLRLSMRVAEKIIGEQLKINPDTVVDIVREVLKGAHPGKRLAIQVNEADAPIVRSRMNRIKECTSLNSDIEVVPSSTVARGGCVIESDLGIIDARLETQLKCLEDVLVRGASADEH